MQEQVNFKSIRSLLSLLSINEWVLGKCNSVVLLYEQKLEHQRLGKLTYTVRIVTKDAVSTESAMDMRDFQLCQLIGPTFDSRNGTIKPASVLAEWRTLRGAETGVQEKFNAMRKEFFIKQDAFAKKSRV